MRTIRLPDWTRTKRLVTAWTLLLGGGAIALAACDHAYAEPPALSPEFRAILWHPQHRGAVVQAAQQSVAWINNPCPSATFTPVEPITIYRAAEFDAQAKPTAGEWKESVTASGCGGERMLNVLTTVPSPGALVSSVLLAGSTRADPVLQRDSVRYAVAASGGTPPNCRKVYIADTKFIGFEGPPDAGLPPERRISPRREEWPWSRASGDWSRHCTSRRRPPVRTSARTSARPGGRQSRPNQGAGRAQSPSVRRQRGNGSAGKSRGSGSMTDRDGPLALAMQLRQIREYEMRLCNFHLLWRS